MFVVWSGGPKVPKPPENVGIVLLSCDVVKIINHTLVLLYPNAAACAPRQYYALTGAIVGVVVMTNLRSSDAAREAILAAWTAVPQTFLSELLQSMPATCQAVINVNGIQTRY